MAFSWTQDVSVGASIDAADVNEIKTNLDSIYSELGITRTGCVSGAGWTELPVSAGDPITSAQFQEMRDVTDYAYDNKCPTYFSGAQASVDFGDNNVHLFGYDSTVYTGQYSGVNGGYNAGHYVSENSLANTTHYLGDNYGDHFGYCSVNYWSH